MSLEEFHYVNVNKNLLMYSV